MSRALRQIGDIERGNEKHRSADAGCERFGHARLGEAKAALGNQTAIAWRQQIEERCGDATHARRKPADLRAHRETFAIQQPSSCAFDQIGDLEEHFDLHLSRHFVVELLDFSPQLPQREHLAHDHVGLRHLGRRPAGARAHVVKKGNSRAIDDLVGDNCRDDLPVQWMGCDLCGEPVPHGLRKITAQFVG